MLNRIKKSFSFIMVMVLLVGAVMSVPTSVYANSWAGAGSGTEADPYQIKTAEQLAAMNNFLDAHFVLMNDLDLTDFLAVGGDGHNEGNGWVPIGAFLYPEESFPFTGAFDGGGYTIKNLMINRGEIHGIGFFGYTMGSKIKNVGLINVHVATGNESVSEGVGGLVGYSESSTITNSYVIGDVFSLSGVGGLVGYSESSTITNSYATGTVGGYYAVGGLAGYSISDTIMNSYATGDVNGSENVGGLVGYQYQGEITNSFATGALTPTSDDYSEFGGLVGYLEEGGTITNSYYDKDTTGEDDTGKGVGKTTAEMMKKVTFAGWDFETIWSIDEGNTYPTLRIIDEGAPNVVRATVEDASPYEVVVFFDEAVTNTNAIGVTINVGGSAATVTGAVYDTGTNSITFTINTPIKHGQDVTMVYDATLGTIADLANNPMLDFTETVINRIVEPAPAPITTAAITGVTAPVRGATPTATIADTTEYTAAIAWSPADATFAAGKAYIATITLTPKAGYTLTGVSANFFTVAGAISTTHAANTGVITAVFPATQALSSAATLTSTIGTVSTGGTANETITGIPNGTTLAALKAALTSVADATFEIYDPDGTILATTLATGKKVIVTAQDEITKVTYTVTVRSAPSSSDGDSPLPTNGVVTSTDGTLTLQAGRTGEVGFSEEVTVSIPANATDKELKITIEKVLDTQSLIMDQEVLASPIYEILKNFPENFSKPVTLTFTFDPTSLTSNQRVAVFYYDEVNKIWVEVGGKVSGNTITVDVDHFTKFAVLAVNQAEDLPETEAPTDVSFSDISGHWAEAGIKLAVSDGIVSGYPDGTFKPNHTVTRAEFAMMLMNAWKPQGEGVEMTFTDNAMIGAWAQKSIAQAVQAGIISGYADGTFRPNKEITRAEMALMIAIAMGQPSEANAVVTSFADEEDIPAWAKGSVAYLKQAGIMQGKGNNEFASQDRATRAEAVTVLLNMLEQMSR